MMTEVAQCLLLFVLQEADTTNMSAALPLVLAPLPNLVAAGIMLFGVSRLSFFPAVMSAVVMAVFYVIAGPRVQRSKAVWGLLSPKRQTMPTNEGSRDKWHSPTLVVVHFASTSSTRVIDSLAVATTAGLENAVVCVPSPRVFHLPLSRLAMKLLGGIVPYSRNVLINLLKRKGAAPVVVTYPEPIRQGASGSELVLASKGPFSAALRTGATLVPCVVLDDGVPHFGEAVPGMPADQAPAPEAVIALAGAYAAKLEQLHAKYAPKSRGSLQVKK
jgi:hypothetical protein